MQTHLRFSSSLGVAALILALATPTSAQKSNPERPPSSVKRTVYKLGDKYYGARSNEFGYANYEIIPAPSQLGTEVEFRLQ